MKANCWNLLLWAFLASVTCATVSACPSLTESRSLYDQGKTDQALSGLLCLEKKYPRDLDIKRFISDIYWWQGNVEKSVATAEEGENLNPWDEDPNTAIHFAERSRPWRLTASVDEIWGDQQTGTEFFGLLDYRYTARDHINAGFSRIARNFDNGSSFVDRVFRVGYARLQGKRSYLETAITYSPDHNFSPEYSLSAEPHYVLEDDSDVSFLVEYLHFVPEDAFEFSPGWRKIFGLWTFKVNVNLLEAGGDFLPSLQLSAAYFINPKTEIKGFYGFGRALEGPYLEDSFYSVGGVFTRYIDPALALNLRGSIYRADLYNENRVALGADWFF